MMRRRWLKLTLIAILPLALLAWAFERRSWRPRVLGTTPSVVAKFPSSTGAFCLAWAPDGGTLAVARGVQHQTRSSGTTRIVSEVQVWSVAHGTLLWRGRASETVTALAWSPDGAKLAALSIPGQLPLPQTGELTVRVWNAASGGQMSAATSRRTAISADYLAGAPHLAWEDGRKISLLRAQGPQSIDIDIYATGCVLERWDTTTGRRLTAQQLSAPPLPGSMTFYAPSAALSSEGSVAAVVPGGSYNVKAARLTGSGSKPYGLTLLARRRARFVAFQHQSLTRTSIQPHLCLSRDGSIVALLRSYGQVDVLSSRNAQKRCAIQVPRLPQQQNKLHSFALSPEGSLLATHDGAGTIALWDANTGALLRELAHHTATSGIPLMIANLSSTSEMTRLQFSPDSSSLAFVANDGTITLWRVR